MGSFCTERGSRGSRLHIARITLFCPTHFCSVIFKIAPFTSSSRFLKICAIMHSMKTVIASHWTTDGDRREHRPSALLANREHRGKSGLICCCCSFIHIPTSEPVVPEWVFALISQINRDSCLVLNNPKTHLEQAINAPLFGCDYVPRLRMNPYMWYPRYQ